jgi:hypothetical protein
MLHPRLPRQPSCDHFFPVGTTVKRRRYLDLSPFTRKTDVPIRHVGDTAACT